MVMENMAIGVIGVVFLRFAGDEKTK
jgi:hypothetical protein